MESISERQIPLYVRVEDGEFFTELGGDIVNILQREGYGIAHVERRVRIHELKGTASLIPTIRTAYMQDTGRRYLEKKPLTAVSLKGWMKGATPSDKALPALIALNKETNMENLPADAVFSLVTLYRYFDPGLVESMLDREGMWDFDVADRIFERFKDVLTEHPELIDEISAKAASSPVEDREQGSGVRGQKDVGGIDLNPALLDLQIKRDANFVPLPLPQQPIQQMHIEGFIPVIINITPVTNLPMLLGLADTEPDMQEISPASKARDPEEISVLN